MGAAGKGGMLGALMMTNMMGTGGGAMGAMLQPSPGGVPASGASGQVDLASLPFRVKSIAQAAQRNTPAARNSVLIAATRTFPAPAAARITTKPPAAA